MMNNSQGLLLASLLAGSLLPVPGAAGSISDNPAAATTSAASKQENGSKGKFAGSRPSLYYKRTWGIDVVGVHPVASGEMLEFRYRVLDRAKAEELFDKKFTPYLIDQASGTRLAVPTMENIGTLRQDIIGTNPERIYYVIFGNPGKLVKVGSRVDVVIGNFHLDGLIVD